MHHEADRLPRLSQAHVRAHAHVRPCLSPLRVQRSEEDRRGAKRGKGRREGSLLGEKAPLPGVQEIPCPGEAVSQEGAGKKIRITFWRGAPVVQASPTR